jgi:hypothetical protein
MNELKLIGSDKRIILDKNDAEYLKNFSWCIDRKHIHTTISSEGKPMKLPLHRFLIKYSGNDCVIHKNKNYLDFRRSNLVVSDYFGSKRQCATKSKNTTSKYKGVHKRIEKYRTVWSANIRKGHKRYYLGRHATEEGAAMAYNKMALQLFGEDSYQNEIKNKG